MNTFTVKKNREKHLNFSARNKTLWWENSKFCPNNLRLIKLLLYQPHLVWADFKIKVKQIANSTVHFNFQHPASQAANKLEEVIFCIYSFQHSVLLLWLCSGITKLSMAWTRSFYLSWGHVPWCQCDNTPIMIEAWLWLEFQNLPRPVAATVSHCAMITITSSHSG